MAGNLCIPNLQIFENLFEYFNKSKKIRMEEGRYQGERKVKACWSTFMQLKEAGTSFQHVSNSYFVKDEYYHCLTSDTTMIKSAYEPKWPIRPELFPVSVALSDQEYCYSPLDGMPVLPKNTTQCPRPGLEPRPLDPESSSLTMRPPRLPMLQQQCRTNAQSLVNKMQSTFFI